MSNKKFTSPEKSRFLEAVYVQETQNWTKVWTGMSRKEMEETIVKNADNLLDLAHDVIVRESRDTDSPVWQNGYKTGAYTSLRNASDWLWEQVDCWLKATPEITISADMIRHLLREFNANDFSYPRKED